MNRWFRLLPISALVLLAGIVGITQLREQAGIESGYLMAGGCLILAGLLAAQSFTDNGNTNGGGTMGDISKALRDQTAAINDLAESIQQESQKIVAAVNARDTAAAQAIVRAIDKRTQQIVDITEKVTSDKGDQTLPTGPTGGRGDQTLPTGSTGPTGGADRPNQGLPETPEPKR